ncbi:Two-component sensor histidine kinase, contains HisKA and HATPase domains [Propionibacterium cyclohexanicum]|uniref:histidine kinase n=1 Tax=Propionibacterium cyclohexanicum TaxID=64702 RepID=A0A1H9R1C2_9ACTN|nr:sensor histidine kinase [Propionibacterium cyclohexanicum]SER65763.1 Two-component sensor histidine kinase, contains HisKA and HATPase domains [Propionibacterium cyclohexanicum]
MLSMSEVLAEHTVLGEDDRIWLTAFVREWHLLSDTSFSDLVLWVPDADENVFWAAAQRRPVTGPTALEDDVVGDDISYEPDSLVVEAYLSREISETSNNKLQAGIPVDVWAIPIIRHGEVIGIVERHTNQMGVRAPGAMEDCYLEVAEILADMVRHGIYPIHPPSDPTTSPRVGDGLVYATDSGVISYASPNAVSAYRRLGLVGDMLGEGIRELSTTAVGAAISPVAPTTGHDFDLGSVGEFDTQNEHGCVRLRVMPLSQAGHRAGVLVTCRDITELRDRERELVTKDATIREIHHRVKNNLQTVAALLRLQARRCHSAEAESALYDAMSRVQSIAVVHEILSQSFDEAAQFDEVADKILQTVGDVASTRGGLRAKRQGSFGLVPAKVATSLSLIMTELCQNALEHGLGDRAGEVFVRPRRDAHGALVLDVVDQGAGLPEGFVMGASDSLGTSIVTTLVADLGGEFTLFNNPGAPGATSRVIVPAETLRV